MIMLIGIQSSDHWLLYLDFIERLDIKSEKRFRLQLACIFLAFYPFEVNRFSENIRTWSSSVLYFSARDKHSCRHNDPMRSARTLR